MPTWDEAAARDLIEHHRAGEGTLLVALHALAHAFGHVDRRAIPLIAEAFNLTRAEITGVVTFYKDFRAEPPCRHVIKLCRAEACQAVGSERVAAELEGALGADVTLETVYCLGNCALGPAALVDGKLYGRVDAASLRARVGR